MNKWVKRGGVALGVVVIGAGVAVRRDGRSRPEEARTPCRRLGHAGGLRRDAGEHRARPLPLPLARLRRLPRQGRRRPGRRRRRRLYIRSPNITSSPQSATAAYAPADWVRSVRHGVSPDGRALLIMPSEEYAGFVDADLAAVVAYIRQLPPSGGPKAEIRLPPLLKALYGAGELRDASEKIDHGASHGTADPRRRDRSARRLRRPRLRRLSRPEARRRQDPGSAALLAACRAARRRARAARSIATPPQSSSWPCSRPASVPTAAA